MPSLVESSSESDSDSDEADYKEIDTQESWRSQPASVSQGRLPLRQVQIFLSGVHGRTITLEVALDDTVDAVLSKIEDKEGVPCNGPHRIVFSCRTLQRHRTLTDYGVCPDATLQMLALPRGGSGKHTSETATGAAGSGLESASASTFGASAAPAATIGGASTGGFGASTGGFGASAGGFGPPSGAAPGSGFAFGATPSAPTNSAFAFGATAAQATHPAGSFVSSTRGMGASSGGMFDAVVATVTQVAPSCPQWAGQIFIQRAGRRTFVLNVTSDDTVASLKARLKWTDSRLIKSPLELCDDTRSLGSYGVRKEDTLLLCGRLCGGGVCMGKPTVVAPGENIAPQDAAPAPQAPAAPTAPEEVAAPAALYHDAVDAEGGAGKPAGDECREVVGDCASLSAGTPAGETSPLGASVVLDAPSTPPVSFPSPCCRLCRCRVRGSALKLPVPASIPRYCCSRSRCRGAYVGVGVGLGMCVGAGRPKVHKVLPDARVCLRNNTVYVCV